MMIITYINIEDGPKVKTPIVVMSTCLDNLMLSTELIQTSVSSVSPSSERIEELWLVCVFIWGK